MNNNTEPTCKCGKAMTPLNSVIAPELFLCDECCQSEDFDPRIRETLAGRTPVPKKDRGLFDKFRVARTDNQDAPGGKHHGCPYFVLDMKCDPFAVPALNAYADACEKAGYQALADDLRKYVAMNIGEVE